MLKAVIIEDELHSRELLKEMVLNYCTDITLAGMAGSVSAGVQLIQEQQPDLIFLDIYISEGNGFDILDHFQVPNFKVIFVTGYEQYAIKAIKYSALDYLLKPIILDELRLAVNKAKSIPPPPKAHLHFLEKKIATPVVNFDQIVLTDYKKHSIVNLKDIVFIEAKRSYTVFHLIGNQTRITSNPLSHYDELLPETIFFRIHKSYIVNCNKVAGLETGRGGQVKLTNDQFLPVAVRRKSAFLRFINSTGV